MISNNYSYNNKIKNKVFFHKYVEVKNKKSINIYNNELHEKALLIFKIDEVFQSTVGMNISRSVRYFINLSFNSKLHSQIIGHLLGDGNLTIT
jgi:hypothetical protein